MPKVHSEEFSDIQDAGSFRDPSGFVFTKNGVLYRQVNRSYSRAFDSLMKSGLYAELVRKGYMIPHEEVSIAGASPDAYKIIRPERIPFISYPYEWCFSELKDAALLTLKIQKIALRFGMCLKDASAYNIQFKDGHPILIDTLSFDEYKEGMPWVAYRQFCEHFVAPLALMSLTDVRLNQLLRIYIDGIPLDLASKLLPRKSWVRAATFFHVYMHAKSQRRFSETKVNLNKKSFSRGALDGLLESLSEGVSAFKWNPVSEKREYSIAIAIEKSIDELHPHIIWNFSPCGEISKQRKGTQIVLFRSDPALVETKYLSVRRGETNLLPLILDLKNPSPAIGWANKERLALVERGPADLVVALELIQDICILNNVPFGMAAEFFSKISRTLIIEFVPKADASVQLLLKNRADIFDWYVKENFEKEFGRYFEFSDPCTVFNSNAVIYVMKNKAEPT